MYYIYYTLFTMYTAYMLYILYVSIYYIYTHYIFTHRYIYILYSRCMCVWIQTTTHNYGRDVAGLCHGFF